MDEHPVVGGHRTELVALLPDNAIIYFTFLIFCRYSPFIFEELEQLPLQIE